MIIAGSQAGSLWHSRELHAKAAGLKELFVVDVPRTWTFRGRRAGDRRAQRSQRRPALPQRVHRADEVRRLGGRGAGTQPAGCGAPARVSGPGRLLGSFRDPWIARTVKVRSCIGMQLRHLGRAGNGHDPGLASRQPSQCDAASGPSGRCSAGRCSAATSSAREARHPSTASESLRPVPASRPARTRIGTTRQDPANTPVPRPAAAGAATRRERRPPTPAGRRPPPPRFRRPSSPRPRRAVRPASGSRTEWRSRRRMPHPRLPRPGISSSSLPGFRVQATRGRL